MSDTLHADHILHVYGGTLISTLDGGMGVELIVQLNVNHAETDRFAFLQLPDGRKLPILPLTPEEQDEPSTGAALESQHALSATGTLTIVQPDEMEVE